MSSPPVPPSAPPPPPRSPYAPPGHGGSGEPPRPVSAKRLPWEERSRLGFFEALFQTIRLLITEPSEAFSRLRADGDLTSPILFGVLLSWVSTFASQIWNLMFSNAFRSIFEGIEGFEQAFMAPSTGALVGTLLAWPIIFIVVLFLGSGIIHLMLMLVQATESSAIGFEGTVKVYAYAQVTGLASLVPVVGGLVYPVWMLVLSVIGYAIVHNTTQGRALAAVLLLVGLCCVCGIVFAIGFGAMFATVFSELAAQ